MEPTPQPPGPAAVVEGLREMSQIELEQIDRMARQAKEKAQALQAQWSRQITRAAAEAIANTPVPADSPIEASPDFMLARLNRQVSHHIYQAGQSVAEEFQIEIQQDLQTGLNLLYALAVTIDRLIRQLDTEITRQQAAPFSRKAAKEVTLPPSEEGHLKQVWTTYREIAITYEQQRKISDPATNFAVGVLLGACGIPALTAAVLATEPGSILPKEAVPDSKQLKTSYQQTVLATLQETLKAQQAKTAGKIEAHILNSFETLKRQVDLLLDQAQQQLDALYSQ